jgi:hypothetical protein
VSGLLTRRLPTDLLEAIDIIEGEGGGACWLVGGCVRDCLSGITPWEIDMATTLHPQRLLELFPRALDTGSQVKSSPSSTRLVPSKFSATTVWSSVVDNKISPLAMSD